MKKQNRCQNRQETESLMSEAEAFSSQLLAWFQQHRRPLPWRAANDPYHVWVSEVMAQQTRIETMIPYYLNFLQTFPTVQSLADSPLDQVLTVWAGLGYYRRAENMHRAARIMVDQYQGEIPGTYEVLRSLPGIGEYMAGAILSIAFHQKQAAVDGNVTRVAARIASFPDPFRSTMLRRKAKAWVMNIMPADQAGLFNQALMELGALVCTPNKPACHDCPVKIFCMAFNLQRVDQLPVRSERKRPSEEEKTVVLVVDTQKQVLMKKRKAGLLKGMWEYVLLDGQVKEIEIGSRLQDLGISLEGIAFIGASRHVFSHRTWNMVGYSGIWAGNETPAEYAFNPIAALDNLPLPTAFRYFTQWLQDHIRR